MKRPVQKQLWRQIVQAKIRAQGRALPRLNGNDQGLSLLVKPGDVVYIPPFTRHVARGNFEIINVVHPPFDPSDEYLDE